MEIADIDVYKRQHLGYLELKYSPSVLLFCLVDATIHYNMFYLMGAVIIYQKCRLFRANKMRHAGIY